MEQITTKNNAALFSLLLLVLAMCGVLFPSVEFSSFESMFRAQSLDLVALLNITISFCMSLCSSLGGFLMAHTSQHGSTRKSDA